MVRSSQGLTLVEVLIVVTLVAMVALATLPSVGNLISVLRTRGASEQVASAIRQTRQLALTAADAHCIALSGTTYEIRQGICPGTALDGPVTLIDDACVGSSCTGSWSFSFTPAGGVDPVGPTTVTVTAQGCSVNLTVTPVGGVVLRSPPC